MESLLSMGSPLYSCRLFGNNYIPPHLVHVHTFARPELGKAKVRNRYRYVGQRGESLLITSVHLRLRARYHLGHEGSYSKMAFTWSTAFHVPATFALDFRAV